MSSISQTFNGSPIQNPPFLSVLGDFHNHMDDPSCALEFQLLYLFTAIIFFYPTYAIDYHGFNMNYSLSLNAWSLKISLGIPLSDQDLLSSTSLSPEPPLQQFSSPTRTLMLWFCHILTIRHFSHL